MDFRYKRKYAAADGGNGGAKRQIGADAGRTSSSGCRAALC